MSATVNPNIPLGFNPVSNPALDIGKITANAAQMFQLQQAGQDAQRQNALRNLLGQPGTLDDSGMIKPEMLNKVMAIDPNAGMTIAQNNLKAQHERMQLDVLKSKAAYDQSSQLNDAYSPILETYEQGVRDGKIPEPVLRQQAQEALTSANQNIKQAGWLSPNLVQTLPTEFDPAKFRQRALQSESYRKWWEDQQQTDKDKAKAAAEAATKDEETFQRPDGTMVIFRPNAPVGQRVTGVDGQPLPETALSGATKMGGKGGSSTAAQTQQLVDTVSNQRIADAEKQRGTPLSDAEKATIKLQTAQEAKAGTLGTELPPSDVHGTDYLKTIPTAEAAQVKALAEGRMQFPAGTALRDPHWQKMLQEVANYDPTFDAVNFNARAKVRADFTSGPSSKNVTSIKTAIGHLAELADRSKELNNAGWTTYNTLANYLIDNRGDPRVGNFNLAKTAVIDELTRAFRGTGGNVADLVNWEKSINSSKSPSQLQGAIQEAIKLLGSRIDSLNDTYQKGLNTTTENVLDLLTPKDREILANLPGGKKVMGDIGGRAASEKSPAGSPEQAPPVQRDASGTPVNLVPMLQAKTLVRSPDGTQYYDRATKKRYDANGQEIAPASAAAPSPSAPAAAIPSPGASPGAPVAPAARASAAAPPVVSAPQLATAPGVRSGPVTPAPGTPGGAPILTPNPAAPTVRPLPTAAPAPQPTAPVTEGTPAPAPRRPAGPRVSTLEAISRPVPQEHSEDPDGTLYNSGKYIKRGDRIFENEGGKPKPLDAPAELTRAAAAIRMGAPRDKVYKMLREAGIDPKSLDDVGK